MGNFTKFLKNKNTVTILGVIACLVILYIGYSMRINSKTALIDVYYANQTIQPKTIITDDMISKTSVPASFIQGTYYKNYSDIVGKYSNYNTVIAKGSLFYSDLLIEEANLPDAMLYDINEGERLVSFPVTTESTYGNSLMPSDKVDVYVKYVSDNKIIYGEFFDKVDILAVKDSAGNNVFENTDAERTPAYIYFSLEEAKYLLFESLQYVKEYYGADEIEIVLVPNTKEYKEDEKIATEVYSSDLYDYVLGKLKTIDEQKDLYNDLLNEMETLEQKRKDEANKQNQTQNNPQ